MTTARVDFTRGAAERIARAVRIVEQGDRDQSPLTFSKVIEGSSGSSFRVCKFTGSWSINQLKTVVFINKTSTPNTVIAQNIFVNLSGPTSTATSRNCAIARDGSTWYLVAAQCS